MRHDLEDRLAPIHVHVRPAAEHVELYASRVLVFVFLVCPVRKVEQSAEALQRTFAEVPKVAVQAAMSQPEGDLLLEFRVKNSVGYL